MAANKPFGDSINQLGNALSLRTITPSDSIDMVDAVRMIYVGVSGDVNLVDSRGNTVLHKNVFAGSYLGPFSVMRVMATSTTATNLIGYV